MPDTNRSSKPNLFWLPGRIGLRAGWRIVLNLLVMLFLSGCVFSISLAAYPAWLSTLGSSDSLLNLPPELFLLNGLVSSTAMTMSVFIASIAFDRRRFSAYGLQINRRWGGEFLLGLLLGGLLMSLLFGIERLAGWLKAPDAVISPNFTGIALSLLLYTAVGWGEEILARGFQFTVLREGFLRRGASQTRAGVAALLASSILFATMHSLNPHMSPAAWLNLMLAGIMLGLPMLLTGRLGMSIGLHITWNFFQGAIFSFPVSGSPQMASLFSWVQTGPAWLTGGAFGPEGGLLGTLIMLLGIGCMFLFLRPRNSD